MGKRCLCGAACLILMVLMLAGCGMRASPGRDHRAPTFDAPPPIPLALATLPPAGAGRQTETPQIQIAPSQPIAAGPCGDRAEITKMVVRLTPAESQELVQRVLDLGFERLESYPDSCRPLLNDMCECVKDAGTSILRLRLASGELCEVRNYHTFANDPDALAAIRTLLEEYQHPQAEPYIPEKIALSIQAVEAPAAVSPSDDLAVQDWPLDPSWLAGASTVQCYWVLSGSDAGVLLAATGRNIGDFYLSRADMGTVYRVFLTPWLPGVDYTERVASSGQACLSVEALPLLLPESTASPGMPQPGTILARPGATWTWPMNLDWYLRREVFAWLPVHDSLMFC